MNKPTVYSESDNDYRLPRKRQIRVKWVIGAAILLAGLVTFFMQFFLGLQSRNPAMVGALTWSSVAALATALGALPLVTSRPFSQRFIDMMMGFGAGVMLAASAFSLILPALLSAREQGISAFGSSTMVGASILAGALVLYLFDRAVPHEHFVKGVEGGQARMLKRAWLFVLAITLHNFPEGLAIGVAFAGPDAVAARSLAVGIAIQNIPEGMVVAFALRAVGYSRLLSASIAILSGTVEIFAAGLGVVVLSFSSHLLPLGMGAAAGAMLFVISHEIIPESHRKGHEAAATGGLIWGFVLMMVLDTALG